MTDQDTLELRRIVADDPVYAGTPDLAALVRSGQRIRRRRHAIRGGAVLGGAALLSLPFVALLGIAGGPDRDESAASPPISRQTNAEGASCGVLSCARPEEDRRETGEVTHELSVGTLPDGAEELLYVARTKGVGSNAGEMVDVLKAGYRHDRQVYATSWALRLGKAPHDLPRFWSHPGLVNTREGSGDHYVVLGYVVGTPDEITWSTPDGDKGEVDGTLALDGYTAFYLTRPFPDGYTAPPRITRNEDGSYTIGTGKDAKILPQKGIRLSGLARKLLQAGSPGSAFPPSLTISTSEGWSCTLQECGSIG